MYQLYTQEPDIISFASFVMTCSERLSAFSPYAILNRASSLGRFSTPKVNITFVPSVTAFTFENFAGTTVFSFTVSVTTFAFDVPCEREFFSVTESGYDHAFAGATVPREYFPAAVSLSIFILPSRFTATSESPGSASTMSVIGLLASTVVPGVITRFVNDGSVLLSVKRDSAELIILFVPSISSTVTIFACCDRDGSVFV